MSYDADRIAIPDSPDAVAERRADLFCESPAEMLERWALGLAWPVRPKRIAGLPGLARLWLSDLIARPTGLPDPERTYNAGGLCGIAHRPTPELLLEAYARGLFTFAHVGPLKWVSLDERCILKFDELHIAKRLRRQMRQAQYRVTFDRDLEGVMIACAGRREGRLHLTWITPRMMRLFAELFDQGHVHSFEVWNEAGALVGGGFGVAVGKAFFTESQFSHEDNTSKLGFTLLNWHLARWGYVLNDGKWPTPTITSMGFRTIPRREFRGILDGAAREPGKVGRWRTEAELPAIANWQPGGSGKARPAESQ